MYFSTIPVEEHYVTSFERKELPQDVGVDRLQDLLASYLAHGDEKKVQEILQKEAMQEEMPALYWLLLKGFGLDFPAPEYFAHFSLDPYLNEGISFFNSHRFEEALYAFNASLERGATQRAYYWRATTKAMMNDFSGAFQDYVTAERFGEAKFFLEKAIVLSWMGQLDEAKEMFERLSSSSETGDWIHAMAFEHPIEPQKVAKKEKKPDVNEKKVRKALVKVWTKILEKYARPGAFIPSQEAVRKELVNAGVDAAVDVVLDENWWAMSFMVRGEIEEKVKKGLNQVDFAQLIEDTRTAQHDPAMLNYLREQLKRWVLNC